MTVKHGYQPMHPPKKHVSQEEMWRTLAKYTLPQISTQALNEGQTPKAELRLRWAEPVKTGQRSGYVLTACGSYSISKDVVGESVLYTAWKRLPDLERHGKPWKQLPVNLGCVATREEAATLCQHDVDGNREASL